MEYWQIPTFIATILGILALFAKSSRNYSRLEKTVEVHDGAIKKCDGMKAMSTEDCAKAQKECRDQQANENIKILQAIRELSERYERSQAEMQAKFESRQQINHDELMKINKSLGRIEGVVGRHKFDE